MDNPTIPNDNKEWFYDSYNSDTGLLIHVKEEIASIETKLQRVKILDTYEFGKILTLNNYMYQAEQGTELTEMLVHVPMNTISDIKKVLLIGAGDGVSLSQLVKYPYIEKIDAVDIDEELTNLCKEKYTIDKSVYEDPRVTWHFEDGFEFIKKTNEKYDLVLAVVSEVFNEDGSPGMAYPIYSEDFYKSVKEHLTSNGIFVSDGTTVHYTSEQFAWWNFVKKMKKEFSIVKPFIFNSKRMPGGDFALLWSSNSINPIRDFKWRGIELNNNYYNQEIHKSSFVLPEHMEKHI